MINSRYLNLPFVVIGGLFMLWPAVYNGYPLVYSDSHVFISQPVAEFMNWDKPFVYGPLILLFHGWLTLWGVVVAQALLLSHLVWLVSAAFAVDSKVLVNGLIAQLRPGLRHLLICAVLALASTAPWFTNFVMPDIFGAMAVLCIFLLGFSNRLSRVEMIWLIVLGALAIAVHLSHLVIAAACLVVVLCLRLGRLRYAFLPLAGAIVILLSTNFYAFQKLSISPHGSVFMLARLSGDGNTKEVLETYCAQKKWYLCAWVDRLPADSDEFLWNGKGPVWSHPGGPIGLAPEASEIVSYVIRTRPWPVLVSALRNMSTQLWMIQLGDTLHADHLDVTVAKSVGQYFAGSELKQLNNSRQMKSELANDALWFSRLSMLGFYGGLVFSLYILFTLWRAQPVVRERQNAQAVVGFILILWVGILANAFATGALSKPHHRYQARIAWLLVLPPLLLWRRPTLPTQST